jgi:sugar phosphate permease
MHARPYTHADRPKVPWRHLLTDTTLWQLAVYFMFAIMVKTCVDNWTHMYIVKERQLTTTIATHFVAAFEAGGLAASVFTGMFTDWLVARKVGVCIIWARQHLL